MVGVFKHSVKLRLRKSLKKSQIQDRIVFFREMIMKQAIVSFEPEMAVIPAGAFLMGCERGAANERPVHRVWIDGFAIARSATTNRLYEFFLADTLRPAPRGFSDARFHHPEQPVTSVNWF